MRNFDLRCLWRQRELIRDTTFDRCGDTRRPEE